MKLFVAKTADGHCLKILAELLSPNLQTADLMLSKDGIKLLSEDDSSKMKILFDLCLDQAKFQPFVYKFTEEVYPIGLNLKHLHDMLKNVKKRDSVELSIDDDRITDLNIQIIPKELSPVTRCSIKIKPSQISELDDLPVLPQRGVLIQSTEFQKMCKSFIKINTIVLIEAKQRSIKFSCSDNGLIDRSSEFGETIGLDDGDDEVIYSEKFETEQILKISKISGLSKTIQVYFANGQPIKFKSDVGNSGTISVYVNSQSI